MSSNFTGVTFSDQRVTPADDALIRRAVLPDGILSGCELSYSGSTLTMGPGSILACGRQLRHPSTQNWPVVDATSGFARLLLTIDLTRTSTESTFDQIVDTVEYASAVDGFPDLVCNDINGNGTKYQIVLCVVSLGASGITGVVSRLGEASLKDEFERRLVMCKIWENLNPTGNFPAQTIPLDLSEYDAVLITMCTGTSSSNIGSYLFEVGSGTHITYGAGAYMGRRNYKVTTTGVVVEGGSKYDGAWDDSNAYQKPLKIYGLKGVQ